MSDALRNEFQSKPRNKPLRQVRYTAEWEKQFDSRTQSQVSLQMYLATLYNERHGLMASLAQMSVSSDVPKSAAPILNQSSITNDPNAMMTSPNEYHDAVNDGSVDNARPVPVMEIQNRPIVTLEYLDSGPDERWRVAVTVDQHVRRNAMRLERTQQVDLANLQNEIESLEKANDNLKLRLEGIEVGAKVKKLMRANMGSMMEREEVMAGESYNGTSEDEEEVKVGESYKGMSEDEEDYEPSIGRDQDSGVDMDFSPSIERDEFATVEKAERERMELIESHYKRGLLDYTKHLERQMAESVETKARNKEIDDYIEMGEWECRAREKLNSYMKKLEDTQPKDTKTTHRLPEQLNFTEAWW
ncbi:MAG: hypothetical protein Q9168_005437 [Polycauliona sp. 1 TL-2023]